jgi:tetratricopeptide (TPR) repeat protein
LLVLSDATPMPRIQGNTRIVINTLAVLILCASAAAQSAKPQLIENDDKTSRGSIRGRIVLPGGAFLNDSIKITLQTMRDTVSVIYTDTQGQFEFPNLAAGNYKLEIEGDRQRFEVGTEAVQVFRGAPSIVNFTLKEKGSEPNSAGAARTASVTELAQNIPAGARREFEKANRSGNDGKGEEAIIHLRKAIAIYPGFVMARNDLGAQLLGLGRLDEAADELKQAIALDEKAFNPRLNLGIVFVAQHRFAEAADVLGKALSLDGGSPAARLYSGIAWMALGNLEAAEKDLRTAYSLGGTPYALALFHLGQLYMNKGDRESARQAFTEYLRDIPNAANADQVRKMIAMLH